MFYKDSVETTIIRLGQILTKAVHTFKNEKTHGI